MTKVLKRLIMFRLLMLMVTLTFILSCGGGDAASDAMNGNASVGAQFIANSEEGFFIKVGGSGDGTSWENAFGNLQSAIDKASTDSTKKKVYVAQGTYKPTSRPNGGDNNDSRVVHFSLRDGVEVIGGFPGNKVGESNDTDPSKTILSGDINNTPKDDNDNAYHVFYHPSSRGLTGSAKLTGVTITKGNANGSSPHNNGGGILDTSSNSTITLTNCILSDNKAVFGGGIYASSTTLNLTNCRFTSNEASNQGGGIYGDGSTPITLTNCRFTDNKAKSGGGAIRRAGSSGILNIDKSTRNTMSPELGDNNNGLFEGH